MTDSLPLHHSPQETSSDLEAETLCELASALQESTQRKDLEDVVKEHVTRTAVVNPNSAEGSFLFSTGDIETHEGMIYRQVDAKAIVDLIESGVVRNRGTAEGENAARWGDRVFWHNGRDGAAINTGGRFVIVAPKSAAQSTWVTVDKLAGVYTTAQSGEIVDLLQRA